MLVEWDDLHKDVQQQIQSSYAVCLTYSFHLEEKLGFVLTQDEIALARITDPSGIHGNRK